MTISMYSHSIDSGNKIRARITIRVFSVLPVKTVCVGIFAVPVQATFNFLPFWFE